MKMGKLVVAFLLSATASGWFFSGESADAYWAEGYNHHNCEPYTGGTMVRYLYGTGNSSTTASLYMHCPIDNNDTLDMKGADSGYVDMYDNNNNAGAHVSAVACAHRWDGYGGACGTTVFGANGTGVRNLSVPMDGFTSAANDEGDYFFYQVIVPAFSTSSSYLMGYTITSL